MRWLCTKENQFQENQAAIRQFEIKVAFLFSGPHFPISLVPKEHFPIFIRVLTENYPQDAGFRGDWPGLRTS